MQIGFIIFVWVSTCVGLIIWFVTRSNIVITLTTTECMTESVTTVAATTDNYPQIVDRTTWKAISARAQVETNSSATLVVIAHTGGPLCFTVLTCMLHVRELQHYDMFTEQMNDIRYNFLIGGDNHIYVGRGVRIRNAGLENSLSIAFIGNFSQIEPLEHMLELAHQLIVRLPWMHDAIDFSSYQIVGENQTKYTDSPGSKLYMKIREWRFYSDELFTN